MELLLGVVGIVVMLEGLFISFYPRRTKEMMARLGRNLRRLRILGLIEFVIGLILLGFVF